MLAFYNLIALMFVSHESPNGYDIADDSFSLACIEVK